MGLKAAFVFFMIFVGVTFSRTIAPSYEIGTWSGFKSAAVSYTFDDDLSNQYKIAIPLFDEFKYKMTLFTVTNWVKSWDTLQQAANNGHEIASHSVTHASEGSISEDQQTTELKNSQDLINSKIKGQKCITFAYPGCSVGNKKIVSNYYMAARVCSGQVESKTPGDFTTISSFICGQLGLNTIQDFNSKADAAVSQNGWCVYLIHEVDTGTGYSPTKSSLLRASLQYMSTNKDKFWVSTFGNVARYIKERDSISVTEISSQSTSISLKVIDNLNDSIYNFPITIRRPLPSGWQTASVSQKGKTSDVQIVDVNSKKYMMFDVIPDGGDIVLSGPSEVSRSANEATMQNSGFIIKQAGSNLLIKCNSQTGSDLSIKIYDLKGSEKVNRRIKDISEPQHIALPQSLLNSGMFIVRVTDGKSTWSERLFRKLVYE